MTGFSEGLHAEVKKFGIHVLTVAPGLMRTGSHLKAEFKGKHEQEYGWFALGGTNPLMSVSAESAARQIVAATRRNQAELIVSWQAKILAHAHGIAPGIISEALALVNKLLPDARGAGAEKKTGTSKPDHCHPFALDHAGPARRCPLQPAVAFITRTHRAPGRRRAAYAARAAPLTIMITSWTYHRQS